MPVIEVDHVTKEYRLGALKGLKQTVLNVGARLVGRQVQAPPLFKALDDVSFSIEQGEVVGIIGHNGAGKSTLLKMLARISTPTSGHVKVSGRIAPLIEVGAGFVPDFTGRENVYLNGSILGMSKKEIDRKFDEIVDFAEMSEFIDTPVKRYSSGMQVKLAFAVATSIEAEILIVDEVLAVGDLAFQRKCFDRMEELIKREGKTVLLVSHNIRQVERICSRAFLLDHGQIIASGDSKTVCNHFFEISDQRIRLQSKAGSTLQSETESTGELILSQIELLDDQDNVLISIYPGQSIKIRMEVQLPAPLNNVLIAAGIHTTDFVYLATDLSDRELPGLDLSAGRHEICCTIKSMPFLPGVYSIRVGIAATKLQRMVFYAENLINFTVAARDSRRSLTANEGFFPLEASWYTAAKVIHHETI
jgi:lipopolysaccharide transport system ATP-binding protein